MRRGPFDLVFIGRLTYARVRRQRYRKRSTDRTPVGLQRHRKRVTGNVCVLSQES